MHMPQGELDNMNISIFKLIRQCNFVSLRLNIKPNLRNEKWSKSHKK